MIFPEDDFDEINMNLVDELVDHYVSKEEESLDNEINSNPSRNEPSSSKSKVEDISRVGNSAMPQESWVDQLQSQIERGVRFLDNDFLSFNTDAH